MSPIRRRATHPRAIPRLASKAIPLASAAALGLVHTGAAHAQSGRIGTLLTGVIDTVIYSIVGIVMTAIGFKVVDWLTPGNLAEEIAHKENRALAILAGAIMLGICIIIAGVISD